MCTYIHNIFRKSFDYLPKNIEWSKMQKRVQRQKVCTEGIKEREWLQSRLETWRSLSSSALVKSILFLLATHFFYFLIALASMHKWHQSIWDKSLGHWYENHQFVFAFLIKIYTLSVSTFQPTCILRSRMIHTNHKFCIADLRIPILFLAFLMYMQSSVSHHFPLWFFLWSCMVFSFFLIYCKAAARVKE